MHRFRFNPCMPKALSQLFLSIDTIVSNDSVSGQQRPRSDCASAQSDRGHCCLHMLQRHTFFSPGRRCYFSFEKCPQKMDMVQSVCICIFCHMIALFYHMVFPAWKRNSAPGPGEFSAFFTWETIFVTSCLLSCTPGPF